MKASKTSSKISEYNEIKSLLALIVQSSNDAIIGTSLTGLVTSWNPAAEKIYGYSQDEMIGKPIDIVIPKNKKRELAKFFKKLRKGQQIKRLETQRVKKDGTLFYVSLTISPIRNEFGIIIGFSTISRDITSHKKVEERLSLFMRAVEEAPDGIQLVDLNGFIIYSNKAVEEIYGFSPKEYKGRNVNEMNVDPTFAKRVIIPRLKKRGRWIGEIMVKHKDGRIFPILLDSSIVRDSQNKPIALLGIIRDITKRKESEELRKEFLSVVAHELRTPLTTLKLLSQSILRRHNNRSINQESMHMMENQVDRLNELINDLLDVSRVDVGKMELQMKELDLTSLVRSVVRKMKVVSYRHTILFKKRTHYMVFGDYNRLEQVLVNFLTNAIKYSPKNSKIEVDLFTNSHKIIVSVKDQGIGIAKKNVKRLFDKFYQVKEHGRKGFGLGLFISKEIIKRHRGKIWVESKQGLGSTFFFSLPYNT